MPKASVFQILQATSSPNPQVHADPGILQMGTIVVLPRVLGITVLVQVLIGIPFTPQDADAHHGQLHVLGCF